MAQETVTQHGSKIAENTVALLVCGVGSALLTLVQLGILSRTLSPNMFGLYAVLRGFSLILATLMLAGLPQVLIRFLPSFQSRGERGRAIRMFAASAAIVIILGAAGYASAGLWFRWFPADVRGLTAESGVVGWLALAAAALALKMLLYGGFSGLREMRLQMTLELVYLLLLTIFILAVSDRLDVTLLFKAICALNTAVFLIGLPIYFRLVGVLIPPHGAPRTGGVILPAVFPYWAGSVLLSFVALAFTDVDRFVMSSMLPVAVISLFHVASRIIAQIKRFLGYPVIATQPEITRVYEEGRGTELKSKIALFTKASFVTSLFVAGLAALVGRDVILLLSGSGYLYSYRILLVLLPTVPIAAFAAPHLMTMKSLHFMRWAVLCDFLYMAVYFGTFALFVSLWGLIGMAVAQVTAAAVQLGAATLLARREGFYGGLGRRVGRVIIVFLMVVPAGVLFTRMGGITASLICLILSPFVGKLLLMRLRVFDEEEKRQILELIPFRHARRTAAWLLTAGRGSA